MENNTMAAIVGLLILAAILEAIWETLKMLWQKGKLSVDRVGALTIGVFLCLAAGVDFFRIVGVPLMVPFAGEVLSGILISRGANFIHDILATVQGLKSSV